MSAKEAAKARRCPSCGNDPRYTPPDHPCDHQGRTERPDRTALAQAAEAWEARGGDRP